MTSSFTFVALAKASAAQFQCKGILEKEIKTKLSLIIEISSKIQVTSSEHIRSEFSKSTNSAKLHSTCTWEKFRGGGMYKGGGAMAPPKFWNFLKYIYNYFNIFKI